MTQTTDERIRDLLLDRLNIMDGTFRAAQATDVASQIAAELDAKDKRIAELDAEAREIRSEAVGLRAGHEAARVAGWSAVWDLQTKHVNTWRDKAEWYWFARFSEEVGELGGALVGNHEGPVEWELSQIAAIALNWLDMRAATERRRNE